LTANFTIFSCNTQGRERLAGGDNFVVRITREGVEPTAAHPPEPQDVTSSGSAPQAESSDTDGAGASGAGHTPNPKSDTEDDQPTSAGVSVTPLEEIPDSAKPIVDAKPKRSGRSKKAGHRGEKSKKSKKRQPQSEPTTPATHRSNTSEEASAEEDAEWLEESDEQARNKVALAVQEDPNDFFAAVTDSYNGTYGVNYTPTFEGEYIMSITLLGIHVEGSPFNISIHPDLRDKTKTLELQLEDEQRKLAEENERAMKEKEARGHMEEELRRLQGQVEAMKLELGSMRDSLEEKNSEMARLEKENAELREQLLHSHKKKHKPEHSTSEDTSNPEGPESVATPTSTLIRSRSGKAPKKNKRQNSDDGGESSTSNTPRSEPVPPQPAPLDAAAKKKARLSSGLIVPAVTIAEDTSTSTKSPRHSEAKQRRRSKGPADAAAIQAALQQQQYDDLNASEKQNDKKMSRSNSAPLNARVEKSNNGGPLTQSSSTNDTRDHDSDSGGQLSGQGEIESRSISYKFSLAFWKLFDKKEPKEAKSKDSSAPKSARAPSTKQKRDDQDDVGDDNARDKKSRHKAK
jgi:hypothetical protein